MEVAVTVQTQFAGERVVAVWMGAVVGLEAHRWITK